VSTAVSVSVRRATREDVGFVSASHRIAHEAIQDSRGGALDTLLHGRPDPLEEAWDAHVADAGYALLIGEVDGTSVGYSAIERQDLPNGTAIALITDLWVHSQARGVGVGAALMHEIEQVASQWGATGLDSRALPGDRVTKNFFESFGLVARAIHVHRSL